MLSNRLKINWTTRLAVMLAVTGLGAAAGVNAQPNAPMEIIQPGVPMAFVGVFGNWYPKAAKPHVNWYSYYARVSVFGPEGDDAGGTAAFGLFDSGEIQLLSYAEYVPALREAVTKRDIMPSRRLLFDDLPRYVMVCSWVTEDGQIKGPRYVAFTERDDAQSAEASTVVPSYIALSASWLNVPAKRVESKFSAHDYCDEIAQTKTSSAIYWDPGKKK